MKLTPTAVTLVRIFALILLWGILFANVILVILAIPVLLVILVSLFIKQPTSVEIKRRKPSCAIFSNEAFTNTIDIVIRKGIGIVVLCDNLPPNFELLSGNNLKVIWKGLKPVTEKMEYTVKCTAPGIYYLDSMQWESRHFLNLRQFCSSVENHAQVLEVKPRFMDLKKIRNVSAASKIPLPIGATARMGIPTLEFKELRQYAPGDSFKYINWKATARNILRGNQQPIINEYEKEGKRTVWIFLDNSQGMRFGTNIKNVLDCSLEAVSGLSDYYLKQGSMVALCVYNQDDILIYPGTGKMQYYKILKAILKLNVIEHKAYSERKSNTVSLSLKESILMHKGHIAGSRPLYIIVTRVTGENIEEISLGIKELSKYTGIIKGKLPIIVINISGYSLVPCTIAGNLSAEFLENRNNFLAKSLKRAVTWIDWDPTKTSFTNAFIEQVVKR